MERGQSWKVLILTTKSRKSDIDHCIDTLSEINFTSYLSTISEQSGIVQHLLNVTWFCTSGGFETKHLGRGSFLSHTNNYPELEQQKQN